MDVFLRAVAYIAIWRLTAANWDLINPASAWYDVFTLAAIAAFLLEVHGLVYMFRR